MKTILIPTDFSDASKDAVEYGVYLSKQTNAKLILLHVYHIPVVTSDAPVILPNYDDLEKDCTASLKEFESGLREQLHYTNSIECICRPGFLVDEMTDIVEEKKIDLIIMGITGGGQLSELLVGSNSITVVKNTSCPTIILPMGSKYKPVKTMVFACDMEKMEDIQALNQIKTFVELFDCKLMILNVLQPSEKPNFDKAVAGVKLSTIFEKINYSMHFLEGADLVDSINKFIDDNNADMLIMLPKKHNFFSTIFRESNTKKMAFHSHIPLLAIHD
jgi:nucleotide-binding universal stress UspA family protein